MVKKLTALALGLILCSALAAADDPTKGKATVEPVSFAVSRKLDEKVVKYSSASTTLSVLVSYPSKQFLGVEASSSVTEFKDDKGNSLMHTGGFFNKTQFSLSPQIGTDRTSMIVSVYSNASPGKGATKILLKGQLVAICGLDEKSTDEKELEFKNKAEVKTGDYTVKVTNEKGFGGAGASFSVMSTSPNVKSVTVKDADGKAVGIMAFGYNGYNKSWTYNYNLNKELKKGKVSVTYFSKEEKVTVPVDLSFGVGL